MQRPLISGARRRVLFSLAVVMGVVCASPVLAAEAPKGARINDIFIISGASGQLGELAIAEFLARGVPAKNLILVSRSPEKLAAYAKLGASTRFGDVDQPESLVAAYKGGTRLLMISLGVGPGAAPRPPRHKLAFDAAVQAGVKQISYTSFLGAGGQNPTGLAADHAQSEAYLRASGVAWTSLRNGFYMDGQLVAALKMAETGKATLRPGERKAAPVTRQDCAAVAVAALLYPGHENQAYEITGPELIDSTDLARIVATIVGKPVTVVAAAPPAAGAAGPGGVAPSAQDAPAISNAVAELTGRPATSLRTLLEAHRAELLAAAAKR
jgi:NAD(P)H dehydrogenase (quinone)